MNSALVVPLLVVALVLAVSGLAKVADREATEDMFTSLRIPLVPPVLGARVLPWAEVALALGLVLTRGRLLLVVTVLTVAVFAAYWVVIARALTFDPPVSCACFGKLGGHRVDRSTLLRNTILVGLAALGVVAAARDVDVLRGLAGFDSGDVWWLVVLVAVAALAYLVALGTSDPSPGYGGEVDQDGEYVRMPIPHAVLEDWDGGQFNLRDLAAAKARLLVMLSPGCGACQRIAEAMDGWYDRIGGAVEIHAVYPHKFDDEHLHPHHRDRLMHQPGQGVGLVLGMPYTPSAVLLGTDGLLAGGPVVGAEAVTELVEDTAAELGV